ncbi:MAG: hypothetical protein RIS90_1580 [Pseudomonadota bacterium]|jgi:hypothetical protein
MTKPAFECTTVTLFASRNRLLRNLRKALLVCFVPLLYCGVAAKVPDCGLVCEVYGGLLLATERELIGSIRTLEKVAKPVAGPRNTRGRWVQREVYLGPEAYDTIFYLRNGLVQRIELTSTAPDVRCRSRAPWAATVAVLGAWQGKDPVTGKLDTGSSVQQSSHWASDDLDVSVYLLLTAETCTTKVVFKKREAKDATVL